ncbi:ribbon-helix-helix protein, CopG family [PVC group bacterium]|nr:ribbon-helix-helix protein, CopG family [PVC group bacterium]
MTRATKVERVRRINAALAALREHGASAAAARALAAKYDMSMRQAYRYVQEAEGLHAELPLPDRSLAFTVKLPRRLIAALRDHTRRTGRTLSEVVAEALRKFLFEDRERG